MKITAIYDNGGKTIDRYTVVTNEPWGSRTVETFYALGLDDVGGSSFSQWGEAKIGRHLGKRIHFEDLNETTQAHIAERVFGDE